MWTGRLTGSFQDGRGKIIFCSGSDRSLPNRLFIRDQFYVRTPQFSRPLPGIASKCELVGGDSNLQGVIGGVACITSHQT